MSTESVIDEVAAEMRRQDVIHPDGYPATRDGVRLGIATIIDEANEALDEWRLARCKCQIPRCGHHDWTKVRAEAVQAAAVALRMVVRLDRVEGGGQ